MFNGMKLKLGFIAEELGGELSDNKYADLEIDSFAKSPEDSTENDMVFIYAAKYISKVKDIKAKAAIVPIEAKEKLDGVDIPFVFVERPKFVLKKVLSFLEQPKYTPSGVSEKATIDKTAKIGKDVAIGENVFIGANSVIEDNVKLYPNVFVGSNVTIGEGTTIKPNCTIMDYSVLGKNNIVHSGAVIGSDGYSYVTEEDSNLEKIQKGDTNLNMGRQYQHKVPTVGNVVTGDYVEIGSNTCIDVATVGTTYIGEGTKVDNLVQIAHNCKIGKDCLVVGQVGFAGSVELGDRVVIGGQVGFADNMTVGDDVLLIAQSGVHGSLPSQSVHGGTPAVPYKDFIKREMNQRRIPRKTEKLEKQVKELEEKLKALEEKLNQPV